jgi:Glutaredoxin and related proteins
MRLTSRSTFPNIVVQGKSIGGSDEIQKLHAEGSLRKVFESAGVVVSAEGAGKGSKAEGK